LHSFELSVTLLNIQTSQGSATVDLRRSGRLCTITHSVGLDITVSVATRQMFPHVNCFVRRHIERV